MKSLAIASLGATLALAVGSPAVAQSDGAVDWTGPYVGAAFGYNWQKSDEQEALRFDTNGDGDFGDGVRVPATGANAFSPGFCGGSARGRTPAAGCDGDKDAIGWSVHAGYDKQFGHIVAGAVIEGGKAYISDAVTGYSTTPASYVMTRRIDWNAAARARLGYTTDSGIMPYITGGVAYAKVKNSFGVNGNAANTFTPSGSKEDSWGWTMGGGLEAKVSDNFSIGVLYKWTRYNTGDYQVGVTGGSTPFTNPAVSSGRTDIERGDKFDVQSAMVTTSFRF